MHSASTHSAYSHVSVIVAPPSLPKLQNTIFTVALEGKIAEILSITSLEKRFPTFLTQFCVHFSLVQIKVGKDSLTHATEVAVVFR